MSPATNIHDREALLEISTAAIDILKDEFFSAPGADHIPIAEQLREMVRLHNELLSSAKAPALKGHRQQKGEFDSLMKELPITP